MKKLLVASIAVAFTAVAGAAQLNWVVTGANKDADGETLTGATVALIMAGTGTSASDITYSYSYADGSWTIGGGQLVTVGTLNSDGKFTTANPIAVGSEGWGTGKYSGTDFKGAATSITSQGTGTANAKTYYMIVFDNDYTQGQYAVLQSAANTTIMSPTAAAGITTFSAATGTDSVWTNVPEPCTVALLALGMGALALRRKQR